MPGTVGLTPYAIAVDPAGNVYIAAGRIIKVSNGVVSTFLAGKCQRSWVQQHSS